MLGAHPWLNPPIRIIIDSHKDKVSPISMYDRFAPPFFIDPFDGAQPRL